jgi:hypothetical protein
MQKFDTSAKTLEQYNVWSRMRQLPVRLVDDSNLEYQIWVPDN